MNTTQTSIFEERMPIGSWEKPRSPFPFLVGRILVPINFSDLSKKALRCAIPLARCAGARLIVLNVMQRERHRKGPGLISSPKFEAGKWRKLDERERQLVDLCRQEIGRDPMFEAIIELGKPATEIISAAKAWDVDMIIMATDGSTREKGMLKSSITRQVVSAAPCPVLVVHAKGLDLIPA
jgi:nucleotide-binding universal stress UspA family protein